MVLAYIAISLGLWAEFWWTTEWEGVNFAQDNDNTALWLAGALVLEAITCSLAWLVVKGKSWARWGFVAIYLPILMLFLIQAGIFFWIQSDLFNQMTWEIVRPFVPSSIDPSEFRREMANNFAASWTEWIHHVISVTLLVVLFLRRTSRWLAGVRKAQSAAC